MKDIPIIFSAPMVRALLDGRKTMTRRLLRQPIPPAPALDNIAPNNVASHDAPYLDAYCGQRKTPDNPRGMSRNWCWWTRDDRPGAQFSVGYAPGDRLWVRENFKTALTLDKKSMQAVANEALDAGYRRPWCPIKYEADGTTDNWTATDWGEFGKRRPCIFMPRWASRLTLIVTGVKIERLHEITADDAQAEGLIKLKATGRFVLTPGEQYIGFADRSPQRVFAYLWESLHGEGSWAANPEVVALTFTVHKQNIDTLPKAEAA